jgi:hypothetical protein
MKRPDWLNIVPADAELLQRPSAWVRLRAKSRKGWRAALLQ